MLHGGLFRLSSSLIIFYHFSMSKKFCSNFSLVVNFFLLFFSSIVNSKWQDNNINDAEVKIKLLYSFFPHSPSRPTITGRRCRLNWFLILFNFLFFIKKIIIAQWAVNMRWTKYQSDNARLIRVTRYWSSKKNFITIAIWQGADESKSLTRWCSRNVKLKYGNVP